VSIGDYGLGKPGATRGVGPALGLGRAAAELMSWAVTELIEHHDGLHEDDVLVRVIES
jgi:hypothetical protein